jgi:hypothetical protein
MARPDALRVRHPADSPQLMRANDALFPADNTAVILLVYHDFAHEIATRFAD